MKKPKWAITLLGNLVIVMFFITSGVNTIMAGQSNDATSISGRVVFRSTRGGSIFMLEQGKVKTVSKNGGGARFSHDGLNVYYSSGAIYKYDIASDESKQLVDFQKYHMSEFDVFPNEEQIVLAANGENFSHEIPQNLFVANISGSSIRQLTFFTGDGGAGRPRCSPDGKKIVFTGPDKIGFEFYNTAIYTINSDGSDLTKIIGLDRIQNVSSPTWSPDSQKIVFHGLKDKDQKFTHIYVANADGSDIKQITRVDADHQCPAFSPDGKQIAYSSPRHGSKKMGWAILRNEGAELFTANLDGTNEKRITAPFPIKTGIFPWNVVYAVDQEPDWHA